MVIHLRLVNVQRIQGKVIVSLYSKSLCFSTSLQVQSDAQYKYLYEAVAQYAKRVQKGEKPLDREEDKLLDNRDYVLENENDDFTL